MFKRPRDLHNKNIYVYCLIFGGSTLLTGVGIFAKDWPLFLAYIPFLSLFFTHKNGIKASVLAGHFIWPFIIGIWGLLNLEYNLILTLVCSAASLFILIYVILKIGLVATSLILLALPFFPVNPLMIVGSLSPGLGLWGVFIASIILFTLERMKSNRLKALSFVFLLSGAFVLNQHNTDKIENQTLQAQTKQDYITIKTSDIVALSQIGQFDQTLKLMKPSSTIVLGENMFEHSDIAAKHYWCEAVKNNHFTAYIGVEGKDGTGEIWLFSRETCPSPKVIYRAEVGIPTLTGDWIPNSETKIFNRNIQSTTSWLLCYEGFSFFRWLEVGLKSPKTILILSNDKITSPLPTGILREKLGREFAKLFNLNVFHANTGLRFLKKSKL